jgi:AraC-like DNA-binding protein
MLGAFNGLALSIFLFLSKKVKSIAALFLGILLLAISVRVTASVLLYFNPDLPRIIPQIGHSACFLIGPSLYYFTKATLRQVNTMPASWKWGWGIQLGITLVVGMLFPFKTYPTIWSSWGSYIIYGQWAAYVIVIGILFRSNIKAFFTKEAKPGGAEKFWLMIFGGTSLILLVYLVTMSGIICLICISGPISFSFVLYLTLIYGANMENILKPGEKGKGVKLEKKKITTQDAQTWIAKLEHSILDKALYKDPHLKLSDLAQSVHIPAHQLSQLLNDNLGKSFSIYINEYRIQEACRLIRTNDRLTFEAIGYEVGFNSKSTFYSAFKKITDTTPALFKEGLEKNKH